MAGIEAVVYVNALCEYQDAIWVGTAHGLFAISYQAKEVRQFTVDQGDLSRQWHSGLGGRPAARMFVDWDQRRRRTEVRRSDLPKHSPRQVRA